MNWDVFPPLLFYGRDYVLKPFVYVAFPNIPLSREVGGSTLLLPSVGRSPDSPLGLRHLRGCVPCCCRTGVGVLSPYVVSTNATVEVASLLLGNGESLDSPLSFL